jgi:broad specificity phosphatase PhoE
MGYSRHSILVMSHGIALRVLFRYQHLGTFLTQIQVLNLDTSVLHLERRGRVE